MTMENQQKYIDQAVESFRTLITEQLARTEKMEQGSEVTDFRNKEQITVGIIGGDGIGPYITKAAEDIMKILLKDELAAGKIVLKDIEGLTIENRLAVGKSIPDDVLAEIKTCDVLLKGPTETPKGGTMESANVSMRRELDLYANVRPVKVPEEGIDWTFFRENTEGEYVLGSRGVEIPGKLTMDFKVITQPGVKRIARAAFEFAKNNGKTHMCVVTKANIMKKTDGSFSEICHEVAKDYPGIEVEDYYIDIMTAKLINPKGRDRFQVFVLPNLYGDIITDEAAQIQGGVGTAGSANTGDKYAMFEAIHGSAPRMVEEGRAAYANPMSIIKASEMLLRHIGMIDKADRLIAALEACGDGAGMTCDEIRDKIIAAL